MKRWLWALLSLLFIFSLFQFGVKVVPHFFVVVSSAILTDYLLIRLRRIPTFFPWAALDTGLIVAFVLDPASQLHFKIAAAALAIISKHFLGRSGRHLFNPAAFGLFVAATWGAPISWWVGRLGFLADLVLIGGMVLILLRLKKFRIPLSFLAAFFVLRLFFFASLTWWFSLFFFPLVMLPEPMTSPSDFKEQLVYGGLSAILLVFFGFSRLVWVDSFLQTLLLSNLMFKFGLIKKAVGLIRIGGAVGPRGRRLASRPRFP